VGRALAAGQVLAEVLCVQEQRVVGGDWCVRWRNRWLQIGAEHAALNLPGRRVLIRQLASGELIVQWRGQRLSCRELPSRPVAAKPRKMVVNNVRWTPPVNHPWKAGLAKRAARGVPAPRIEPAHRRPSWFGRRTLRPRVVDAHRAASRRVDCTEHRDDLAQQRIVGRRKRLIAQLQGRHPHRLRALDRARLAIGQFAEERMKPNARRAIVMRDRRQRTPHVHADAQFLGQFTMQTLLDRFPVLALAAGELPQTAKRVGWPALADEDLPVPTDDRHCHIEVFHGFTARQPL
jgi:hypothetical protein